MQTDKKEILRELLLSENRGYVLSIKVKNEFQPIKTAVQLVEHNRIVLMPTCIYGYALEKTTLTLLEIEWVKRYRVLYSNPMYESIRMIKENIRLMRDRIAVIPHNRRVF